MPEYLYVCNSCGDLFQVAKESEKPVNVACITCLSSNTRQMTSEPVNGQSLYTMYRKIQGKPDHEQ